MEQLSGGTAFMTYSMADQHWPELHRLLGVENRKNKRQAIIDNPHIVVAYFHRRLKHFNECFLHKILECAWEWHRMEAQGRGTIHAHLVAKLKHEPELMELVTILYEKRVL